MSEIWKRVEGFEDAYMVSDLGRVKSLSRVLSSGRKKKGVILKPQPDKDGYRYVIMRYNGSYKKITVHRLVLSTFTENANNLPHINHIDGIKDNNVLSNLEWCTASYNSQHAYDNNIRPKLFNELHHASREVVQIDIATNKAITTFPSIREAERSTGARNQSILRVCKGRQITALGFKWEYANE